MTPGRRDPADPPSWLLPEHSTDKHKTHESTCSLGASLFTLQNFPIVQQQEHAYSPRVQLFLYGNDGKVRFSGAHVLRAAAALKHVQLLRGELPPAPEIHLPRACGHYGNRRLCRCAQPRRNEKENVTGLTRCRNTGEDRWSCTHLGFFMAEFSAATLSSSSLNTHNTSS